VHVYEKDELGCNNYRGMLFSSTAHKFFPSTFLLSLTPNYWKQCGDRRNTSVIMIFWIRQILRKNGTIVV
jgi:hypothetical protein